MKKVERNPVLIVEHPDHNYRLVFESIDMEMNSRKGMETDYWQLMNRMYDFVLWRIKLHNDKKGTFLRCGFTDTTIWIGDVDMPILFYIQF